MVIVFDVDGTLFNTKMGISHAFNYVLEEKGYPLVEESDVDKLIGPPVRDSFKKYYDMDEEQAEEATTEYRKVYIERFISESALYNGWREVLKELKSRGDVLAIATMKTKAQIDALLRMSEMEEVFDTVVGAREDGSLKKPDMLAMIKEQFGQQQYYMLGDTQGDYAAAIQNDYKFVFCEFGFGKLEAGDQYFSTKKPLELLPILEAETLSVIIDVNEA